MNIGQFNISLSDAISLLKEFNLFKNKGIKPIGKYSSEIKKVSKQNKHKDIYDVIIKNLDYEILLADDSVFQFSFGNDIRYAFIQNPNENISKEDYLSEFFSLDELLKLEDSVIENLISEIKDYEYEQFLNEQELNLTSNFIRYDASNIGYKPLLHSYSHLHIGLNEHLRIPISKILTPLTFVMFCIKNTYYNNWKATFENNPDFEQKIRLSKSTCTPLSNEFWRDNEKFELFLE